MRIVLLYLVVSGGLLGVLYGVPALSEVKSRIGKKALLAAGLGVFLVIFIMELEGV